MKKYTICKMDGMSTWADMPKILIDVRYAQTQKNVSAYAQIGYHDEELLVHLNLSVPQVRAEEYGPWGMPCKDSCLEFFFQPVSGDPRYINIEYNFNGCIYLGIGTCIQNLIRLLPKDDVTAIFQPDIRKTNEGWEIFYRIPTSFVRRLFPNFSIRSGDVIRANCFACSDLSQPRYLLSWNPVTKEPFTFHHSSCFGQMTFE